MVLAAAAVCCRTCRAATLTDQQRPALTLEDDRVYVAFGGLLGDRGPYRGSVVGIRSAAAARRSPTWCLRRARVPSGAPRARWPALEDFPQQPAPGGRTIVL
jgi:hypothetical protein